MLAAAAAAQPSLAEEAVAVVLTHDGSHLFEAKHVACLAAVCTRLQAACREAYRPEQVACRWKDLMKNAE